MFSFPSFIPNLWGGALVLLGAVEGTSSTGTGLLFANPDHLSSPLQISLDYQGVFQPTGFAMNYPSSSSNDCCFFLFFVSDSFADGCNLLITPIVSGTEREPKLLVFCLLNVV